MNLPNKLTVVRLVLVPIFFISFELRFIGSWGATVISTVLMVACYAMAELSDLLDGKIARKNNLVTDLGKVLDPFADTLSHLTFFVCFLSYGIMPAWCFVIIMWREFAILFMRMLIIKQGGKAMPANIFGKSKTVLYAFTTLLSIIFITMNTFCADGDWVSVYSIVLYVLFSLSAAASLASFCIYLRNILSSKVLNTMTR